MTTTNVTSTSTNALGSVKGLINQVGQLRKLITDECDFENAKIQAMSLSQEGLKFVLETLHTQKHLTLSKVSNPMPIALELTNLLCAEKLSMEIDLIHEITKACRLFTECFYSKALQAKSYVYIETKKKFIENFDKVIRLIPHHRVDLRFELQCARAAARLVPTDKYFFEKYISPALDATTDKTGVAEAKFFLQIGKDELIDAFRFGKERKWVHKVLHLSWNSRAFLENMGSQINLDSFYNDLPSLNQLKGIVREGEKRTHHKVAFCALEALIAFCQNPTSKDQLLTLIKGKDQKPGLLSFIDLQKLKDRKGVDQFKHGVQKFKEKIRKQEEEKQLSTKKLRIVDRFWKVRYRTLEGIKAHFEHLSVNDQKEIVKAFATRYIQEHDSLVITWLQQFGDELPKGSDLKNIWKTTIKTLNEDLKKQVDATEATLKNKKQAKNNSSSSNSSTLQADTGESYKALPAEVLENLDLEILLVEVVFKIQKEKLKHCSSLLDENQD
jgi:hypothetical protein